MSYRRVPFAHGEWYHCFNRGIDKRVTFKTQKDFERFEELLYLANDTRAINRDDFYHLRHSKIMALPREEPLVEIGAYCLMPNHFHVLLHEISEDGITKFMHKVGTGYAAYFNNKYDRKGNLFIKPFRSKHISNDRYLRHVVQYIHLNPAVLFEPGWKKGRVRNMLQLKKKLLHYVYSSLPVYADSDYTQNGIIHPNVKEFLGATLPAVTSILKEAQAYYTELESQF